MDDQSKDYLLDQAMASIAAFKKATELVNAKHPDKSKRKTPTQKLQYLTEFVNDEYDRMMEEYNNCIKNNTDEQRRSI